jgi:hypothetical protein
MFLAIAVGVVVLLGILLAIAHATSPVAPTVETPSQVLGQQRHLVDPSGQSVGIFTSQADLDLAVRSLALGDRQGAAPALSRSVLVPSGTSVLVINTDSVEGQPIRQVRVLSGQYSGQAGWVLANALAP